MVGLRAISFPKVTELAPGGPSSSTLNTRNPLLPTIDAGWLNNSNRLKTIIGFIDVPNLCRGHTPFRKLPQGIKDARTVKYRRWGIIIIRVTNGSQLQTHLKVKFKSQDQENNRKNPSQQVKNGNLNFKSRVKHKKIG
ncbi:hypothetical protein O181_113590 [Austropuccinia psidii MF-1]|uniref:Uncharacterized protein n=1 Tax=Austropuccinia psidii MF-1 TaxID=1389203 RepID=A0A9Q3PUP1_9BASI|nr:hypothetical protein [Austropuccinia psidii MF-1]